MTDQPNSKATQHKRSAQHEPARTSALRNGTDAAVAWDGYDAYLFDIDGTLLTCRDAVHYFAFCNALSWMHGAPLNLDGVSVHGNTDPGILRDAMTLSGDKPARWRALLPEAMQRMAQEVSANQTDICADAADGVERALEHLRSRGATLGVLTGNLAVIGRIKLERSGLLDWFSFFAFSDGFEQRADIVADAVQRIRRQMGNAARICIVGDTPLDVRAARAHQLPAIAVATGTFSRSELAAESPAYCVSSLLDLL